MASSPPSGRWNVSKLTRRKMGIVLWGLHMGFTQGLLATLVADTAPLELQGTAYGVFNLLGGLALHYSAQVTCSRSLRENIIRS